MKKSISILILVMFASQLSASFLHFDCRMACCQEKIISCCLTDLSKKECPAYNLEGQCNTTVFLPIISVSIHKPEFENKLSINEPIPFHRLNKTVFSDLVHHVDSLPFSKPPTAFNIPLLN
ncbi:MAG: hypothetical protein QGH24_03640 [Candidatus Marinimicrobia bacterium]|jgi:hypothetical protein|nr:hypothetical protein [Candidatus Neomarinimicrobiota bacterium]